MRFSEHLKTWADRCGRGSTPAQRTQIEQWCREFSDIPEYAADAAFRHLDAHIMGSEDRRQTDWPRYADIRKAVMVGKQRMAAMMGGATAECTRCHSKGVVTIAPKPRQLADMKRCYGENWPIPNVAAACTCSNGERYREVMGTCD